jgi:hypothetical protein
LKQVGDTVLSPGFHSDILTKVVEAIRRDPKDSNGAKLFTVSELTWFCKNSYNLGLKYTQTWDLQHIIRLFSVSLAITKLFPEDIPSDDSKDHSLKAMLCSFIIASAVVSEARSEENIDTQRQLYFSMRKHVAAFDAELQDRGHDLGETLLPDLQAKLAALLVFDFEAALCLKGWAELGEIIRKARTLHDSECLKAMADCLLRSNEVSDPGEAFRAKTFLLRCILLT